MRTYGHGAGCTQITTYEEDREKKVLRVEQDIRDVVGMIKGSSLKDEDKDKIFAMAAKLLLQEIELTKNGTKC